MSVSSVLRNPAFRVLAVLALSIIFGFAVYGWLGSQRNSAELNGKVVDPTQGGTQFNLPGTIVVAQDGNLYSLTNGQFTRIASGGWTQPAVTPDHKHLIVVHRQGNFSDLYEMSPSGTIQRQLTNDASGQVDLNHWSFYPHVSPNGQNVYYSYDEKYCTGCYLVDLWLFEQPLNGGQDEAQQWSTPNEGTGGDLQPIPLGGGAVLYSKFEVNGNTDQMYSQIWYQRGQGTPGVGLSPANQTCEQPALSPDGTEVAMVCSPIGGSTYSLVVAPLELSQFTLGPETVLATGMPSAPSWAPQGHGLIYFAPQKGMTGPFELNYVQIPTGTAKPDPREVTTNDDFDSTGPPVWYQ
jgi:Tol biopolymer transport system component